jgi:hypothetical protein
MAGNKEGARKTRSQHKTARGGERRDDKKLTIKSSQDGQQSKVDFTPECGKGKRGKKRQRQRVGFRTENRLASSRAPSSNSKRGEEHVHGLLLEHRVDDIFWVALLERVDGFEVVVCVFDVLDVLLLLEMGVVHG